MPMTTEEIKVIAVRAAEMALENKVAGEVTSKTEIKEAANNRQPLIEGFQCNIKAVPLKEYFAVEFGPNEECHPCRMLPLASMYLDVLQKAGKTENAQALEKVYEGGDILTIAEFMDNIKTRAEEGLRQDLEELDCFTESYEEGEDAETCEETV